MATAAHSSNLPLGSAEYKLKNHLLILSTLVATVTYAAGLNLPGGVWQDTQDGHHLAGDVILRDIHYRRYLMFYYCNATTFVASVVVCLLLLALRWSSTYLAAVLQLVMLLDLLGLMGAYAAGSCRDAFTIIYTSLIMSAIFAYIAPSFFYYEYPKIFEEGKENDQDDHKHEEQREVLMLLATFAVTITYVAGLNPPGGFWSDSHRVSDPILKDSNPRRYQAFFVCNTTAFVASLFVALLLLDRKLTLPNSTPSPKTLPNLTGACLRYFALYGFVVLVLFGLAGAYAAGSCRELDATAYVISLIGVVLAYIFLQVAWLQRKKLFFLQVACWLQLKMLFFLQVAWLQLKKFFLQVSCLQCKKLFSDLLDLYVDCDFTMLNFCINASARNVIHNQPPKETTNNNNEDEVVPVKSEGDRETGKSKANKALEKNGNLVILLATLVASITYQAGLDPPGGLWPDYQEGHHMSGDPVLLTTHPLRYKVFFYSNSAAFVTSLVVIIMVQSRYLLMNHTLEAAMLLDLLGLIGAYAAGSCRDANTSIHVVALAGVVLVYVVIHIAFSTLDHDDDIKNGSDAHEDNKKHEMLLLLAILAATLTYQAGLTPPGGFWSENDASGHRAGFPVLQDNYPRRYTVFFYCNAMSFMASIAVIVLLVNPNLYKICMRCHALYVCMVAGMFCLLGAYAAGSSRHLQTSIYVLMLVAAVFAFVILAVVVLWINEGCKDTSSETRKSSTVEPADVESSGSKDEGVDPKPNTEVNKEKGDKDHLREYLMLLGVLAASVTYQTGLKPPGGLWQDNDDGHIAGNSILHDTNRHRYHAFFYSNSTSFMASIVVVVLLLPKALHRNHHELPLWPMHSAILLSMLGLLGGYAAGSTTDWITSRNVIFLVIPVLLYIAAYAACKIISSGETQRSIERSTTTAG